MFYFFSYSQYFIIIVNMPRIENANFFYFYDNPIEKVLYHHFVDAKPRQKIAKLTATCNWRRQDLNPGSGAEDEMAGWHH